MQSDINISLLSERYYPPLSDMENISTWSGNDNDLTAEEIENTIHDAQNDMLIAEVEPLLSSYVKQIKEYPLLTEEEEKKYANLYRNGNSEEKKYAKDIMVTHNLRLVVSVAKRYNYEKLSMEDLIQEGNIGLIAAVERYEPSIGRFSTYAVYRIRQAIQRYRMNNVRTIRLPCHVIAQNSRIIKAKSELESNGQNTDIYSLANKTGLSPDVVQKYQNIMPDSVSLNAVIGTNSSDATELEEFVADPNAVDPADIYVNGTVRNMIEDLMSELNDREKDVIKYYYGLDELEPGTLESVGTIFGITRERVRQIRCNAIRKMQNPKYVEKYNDYIKELF